LLLRSAEIQPLFIDLPLSSLHTTLPLSPNSTIKQTNSGCRPVLGSPASRLRNTPSAEPPSAGRVLVAQTGSLQIIYNYFQPRKKLRSGPAIPKCGASRLASPAKTAERVHSAERVRSEPPSEQVSWFRKQLGGIKYIISSPALWQSAERKPATPKCGAVRPAIPKCGASTSVGKFEKPYHMLSKADISYR
jgi:hypothetical protein